MAIINHGANGMPSGRIGNVVYRSVRGKTIAAAAATSYRTPEDIDSQLKFQRFSFLTSVAKEITRNKRIKPLWKRDDIPGIAAYHKFVSINHGLISADFEFTNFHMAPPVNEFPVDITEVNLVDKVVHIKVNPLGEASGINPVKEMYIGVTGYLRYTHDNGVAKKGLHSTFGRSKLQSTLLDTPYEFSLDVSSIQPPAEFDGATLIFVLMTYNSEENPVRWSETNVKVLLTPANPVKAQDIFLAEIERKEAYGRASE